MGEAIVETSERAVYIRRWLVTWDGPEPDSDGLLDRAMAGDGIVLASDIDDLDDMVIVQVVTDTQEIAAEKALDRPAPLWSVTRASVERMAGRPISADEAERIIKAIEYSTINECIDAAVDQVVGLTFTEEDDHG